MEFAAIFDRYTRDLASVHANHIMIREESEREFQRLLEQDGRRQEAKLPPSQILAQSNHSFRTAVTGALHFYDFRDYTLKDQMDALVVRTNRQYQWLLAEAYELFEDFLEHFYAAAALANKNLWPLRDYGSLTLSELDSATFESLLQRAREKKDKPQSLLHPLRSKLPLLNRFESTNALKTDLWFALNFIEKLRHHIVHTKGIVTSKADFSEQLLKRCGMYNNGQPNQAIIDLIDDYVRPLDTAYYVRLLEVSLPPHGPFRQRLNMFAELSELLPAYAHLLTSCFTAPTSKRPSAPAPADA